MKTSAMRTRNIKAQSTVSEEDLEFLTDQDLELLGERNIQREIEIVCKLDELLLDALHGDRRAVGSIAIAFGPLLLDVAEHTLGRDYAHEAADVLQEFFLSLVEGAVRLRPAHGRAIPWMCGVVRAIARKYRGERDWAWDISDADDEL